MDGAGFALKKKKKSFTPVEFRYFLAHLPS